MSERDEQTQALKQIGDNLATVDSTGESLIESLEGIRLAIESLVDATVYRAMADHGAEEERDAAIGTLKEWFESIGER